MASAEEDKEGIVVSGKDGVDFGVIDTESAVEISINIQNTNTQAGYAVTLTSYRMRSSTRGDEHDVRFSARLKGKANVIRPGTAGKATRTVLVAFHPPSDPGQYEDTLELVFWHVELKRSFVITRRVKAAVGDRDDHEQIRARAAYTGPRRVKRLQNERLKIVRSLRLPTWTPTPWKEKLPGYDIPARVIEAAFGRVEGARNKTNAKANVKRLMPGVFNVDTYGAWWQVLLYVEEEQVKQDLEQYALVDVELTANYPRYELQVPGLAENRPSVLVGDFILVSHADSSVPLEQREWFEGRVHDVRMNDVVLRFGDNFNIYRGNKFDVRFVLNRLPFRRMHHALVNKFKPSRILFPSSRDVNGMQKVTTQQISELRLHNRELQTDEEQMETVAAVLNLRPGSVPFVVFGPPGTGKSVTIIEAIQQLLDRDEDTKILACAPSNSAADQLAVKLMARGKLAVLRLNSLTRRYNDLPAILRDFSCINENKVFAMPPIEDILKYRVVVATCLTAAAPASMGMPRGHFSHIFVDEAGQGKEVEVVLPIKALGNENTNVILAGDDRQLGPVVNSPVASALGMKTSFLKRMMEREIYDLDRRDGVGGRGITIVKLVKNFRSHPAILEFSNEQFYSSELRPCGNRALTHSLENIDELPKKRFPLLFHAIVGKDEREASSPSFFNVDEASQVKKYCKGLLDNQKLRLKAEHIGVITPYHAQRCKILNLLHKDFKLRDVKVGSVEEFQGQERRVIIISTVRSNSNFVASDINRSLGFVANSRRMNVAITRAQALLIVIGNPVVLSLDPLWRQFMNYIHSKGGWRGKQIDWDPYESLAPGPDGTMPDLAGRRRTQAEEEMEENIARIKSLILQTHEDDDFDFELDEDEHGAEETDAARAFERPILREAE
ncbi:hypothetical protein EST38_g6387 [Candolleomyces aberdarensis]|uniref:RNA helicase n=1 Tax=Candolleomyces aberdarensis TaxID=2316362 RepID=A0A4Q2DHR9_9AGAR|nr:hypothetical protein EST38_g6387 [Candolleomyces aberdarensis]